MRNSRFIITFCVLLISQTSWANDKCVKQVSKAEEACKPFRVDEAFESAEGTSPRQYGLVNEAMEYCTSEVGSCYQECDNDALPGGASPEMAIRQLGSSYGKEPISPEIKKCREALMQFSQSVEAACDGHSIKQKVILEPEAPQIKQVERRCDLFAQMEEVSVKITASAVTEESPAATSSKAKKPDAKKADTKKDQNFIVGKNKKEADKKAATESSKDQPNNKTAESVSESEQKAQAVNEKQPISIKQGGQKTSKAKSQRPGAKATPQRVPIANPNPGKAQNSKETPKSKYQWVAPSQKKMLQKKPMIQQQLSPGIPQQNATSSPAKIQPTKSRPSDEPSIWNATKKAFEDLRKENMTIEDE